MSDIVERLRANYKDTDSSGEAYMGLEAADEIERLRTQRMEADCRYTMGKVADLTGSHCSPDTPCMRCEIERLRAVLGPSATKAWEHMCDEIERLRALLKPFADIVDEEHQLFGGDPEAETVEIGNWAHLRYNDFVRARRALVGHVQKAPKGQWVTPNEYHHDPACAITMGGRCNC